MRCWRRSPAARARRCVFFSNFGVAYTCRIIDVPASTGYGEPIQRLFKLKDGEKIVAALSLDPRVVGDISRRRRKATPRRRFTPSRSRATATRCASASSRSSSRARAPAAASRGRPRARKSSASRRLTGGEILIAATAEARGLLCKADEVNYLSGPGKGVILIKLGRRRPGPRLHRVDRRPRSADRRDDAAAPSRPSAPANTR